MTNNSTNCYNCNASLSATDKYCSKCGQKHTTGRITLFNLLKEFVEDQFNLDNKLLKTFIKIFIPGKLSELYFQGKHKSYISPIKLFLITAVVFASAVSYITFQNFFNDDSNSDFYKKISHHTERVKVLSEMDSLHLYYQNKYPNKTTTKILSEISDSLWTSIQEEHPDSINIPFTLNIGKLRFGSGSRQKVKASDIEELSSKELVEKYTTEADSWIDKMVLIQIIKSSKNPTEFVKYIIGKTAIMLFLLMPFLAAFLWVLHLRKGLYYVEHIVFSFHYHAFLFTILSIALFLSFLFQNYLGSIITFTGLAIFIYLMMAMKRVYKQGWLSSFIKICIISVFYITLLSIFFILTTLLSLVFF